MRKWKRFLAVLLAVGMVLGSTNCSVLASGGTEITSETGNSGSTEQTDTDEASTGDAGAEVAGAQEAAAENTGTQEASTESTGADTVAEENGIEEAGAENAGTEQDITEGTGTQEETGTDASEATDAEGEDSDENIAADPDTEADSEILTDELEETADTVRTTEADTGDEETVEVTSAEEFQAAMEVGASSINIASDFILEGDTYLNDEDYGPANITVADGVTLTIQDGCLYMSGVLTVDGNIYLSGEYGELYVVGYTGSITGQGTISGDEGSSVTVADTYLNWADQSYDTLHTFSIEDTVTISVPVYKYLYTTVEKFSQIVDYTEYDWVVISILPDQESAVITIDQTITVPDFSVAWWGSSKYYPDENGDAYYSSAISEIIISNGGALILEGEGYPGGQITVEEGGTLTVNGGLVVSYQSRFEGFLRVEEGGTLTVNGYLYLQDDGEIFDGALLDVAGTLTGRGDIYAYGTNLQQVTGDASGFTGTMDGDLWVNNRLMLAWLDWDGEDWTVNDGYDSGIWISPVDMYSIQFHVMSYDSTDGWSMVQVGADELTATDSAVQVTDITDSLGTYSEIMVSALGEYSLYYTDGGAESLGVSVTCELPDIGYYTASTASEDSLVDSGFADGTVYYVILSNGVSLAAGCGLTVSELYDYDNNEDVTGNWNDYISLDQVNDTVWMLTITGASGNFWLSISAEVENEYGDFWTTERGINFSNWVSVNTCEELEAALATGSNINIDFDLTLTGDLTISGERSVNFNGNVTVPEGTTLTIESTGDGTGGVYVCLSNEITLTVESGGTLVIDGYLGESGGYEEDSVLHDGATINVEEGGTLTVNGDLYMWWSGVEVENGPTSMLFVSGTLDGDGTIYVYVDSGYVSCVGEVTGTNHFTGTVDDGANLLKMVDKVVVDYVYWDDDGNAYMPEEFGNDMYIRPIYDIHQVNFYRTVYNNGEWSYEQIDFEDLSWDEGLTVYEVFAGNNGLSAVAVSLSDLNEYNVYYTDEDGYQHPYTVHGSLWTLDIYSDTVASAETLAESGTASDQPYYLIVREEYVLTNISVAEGSEYVTLTATDNPNVWEVTVNEEYYGTDFDINVEIELYNGDDENQSTWTESYWFGFQSTISVSTYEEFLTALEADSVNINVDFNLVLTEDLTIDTTHSVYFSEGVQIRSGATLTILTEDGENCNVSVAQGRAMHVLDGGTLNIPEGGYLALHDGETAYDEDGNIYVVEYGASLYVEAGGTLILDGQLDFYNNVDGPTDDSLDLSAQRLYVDSDATFTGSGYIGVYVDESYESYIGSIYSEANTFTGMIACYGSMLYVRNALVMKWVQWDENGNGYVDENDSFCYATGIGAVTDTVCLVFYTIDFDENGELVLTQVDYDSLGGYGVKLNQYTQDDGLTYIQVTATEEGFCSVAVVNEDGSPASNRVLFNSGIPNLAYYSDPALGLDNIVTQVINSDSGAQVYVGVSEELTVNQIYLSDDGANYVTLTETEDSNVYLITVNEEYYGQDFYIEVYADVEVSDGNAWTENRGMNFNTWISVTTEEELTAALATEYNINVDADLTLTQDLVISGDRYVGINGNLTIPSGVTLTIDSQAPEDDNAYVNFNGVTVTVESGGALVINGKAALSGCGVDYHEDGSYVIYNGAVVNVEEGGTLAVDGDLYIYWSGDEIEDAPHGELHVAGTLEGSGTIYVWVDSSYVDSVGEVTGTNHFTGTMDDGSNLLKVVNALVVTDVWWDEDGTRYETDSYTSMSIFAPDTAHVIFYRWIYSAGEWSLESVEVQTDDSAVNLSEESDEDGSWLELSTSVAGDYSLYYTDEDGYKHSISLESYWCEVVWFTGPEATTDNYTGDVFTADDTVYYAIIREDIASENIVEFYLTVRDEDGNRVSNPEDYMTMTVTENDHVYALTVNEDYYGKAFTAVTYIIYLDEEGNTCYSGWGVEFVAPESVGPVITVQPESVAVENAGDKATLTVEAEGESLTYSWYYRNPGGSTFKAAGVYTSSVTVTVTEARNGRQMYCEITDANGNSVITDIVTLSIKEETPITIVTQPQSVTVANAGDKATLIVEAEGEGLTYSWYYKNPGSSSFKATGTTTASITVSVTQARNGREMYCVITDANGNSVTTDTVTLSIEEETETALTIITQPQSVTVANAGDKATLTVEAEGEGLTYSWYYKNPGSSTFKATGTTTASITVSVTQARNGRQMYCVITDANGNSVTTDTVTLSIEEEAQTPITIITQPQSVTIENAGDKATLTVEAQGEGLTYSWYYKNPGSNTFKETGTTTASITVSVTQARNGRQMYCVITDANGNSVTTDTVTLSIEEEAQTPITIITQPQSVTVANAGDKATLTVEAEGEGLTYSWYYKNPGSSTFKATGTTTASITVSVTQARNGRQMYCVITDANGNSVTTDTVTLTIK